MAFERIMLAVIPAVSAAAVAAFLAWFTQTTMALPSTVVRRDALIAAALVAAGCMATLVRRTNK
jgi:hypothetical protein